jgi:hypothetical protein
MPERAQPRIAAAARSERVIDLVEAAEVIPFNYTITSYGADYPVDGLVRRLDTGDIFVPVFGMADPTNSDAPGFQREYVWSKLQADRFIESLLLGLPVPGIFLVKEEDNKLLVLDGHQRLRTLQHFYDGVFRGKEFKLDHVQERFVGLRYKDLEREDRRRIDDSIIHATVVRQDEPNEDKSSIYLIFERLNSGGTILQPQEIRLALYHGEFARLLAELNEYPSWRTLYGGKSSRLKDIELIERFFAFYFFRDKYARPMKGFLNRYMATNRHLHAQGEPELRALFENTTDAILEGIGPSAFKPKNAVNAAVLDSIMVGVANRLYASPLIKPESLQIGYSELMESSDYQRVVGRATADEESVQARLARATKAFATAV